MTRNFRLEITAATVAGDVAALSAIAHNLLGRVEQDDERRARQADKKRLQRENRASGTGGTSTFVPGQAGTSGDIPVVVPPQRSITTPPPPSAQVIAKLGDVRLQQSLDALRAKYDAEQWEDVASFFLRRKYDRWADWAKTMLRDVGPGSQFVDADLLRVCQDDGTLEKRIGSAGVLRVFLGYAKQSRMGGGTERSPPAMNGRRPAARVMPGAQQFPSATDPDADVKWTP